MNSPVVEKFIEALNELLTISPPTLMQLINARFPCSKEVANHPEYQVDTVPTPQGMIPVLGLLGVINGVMKKLDEPLIAACIEEAGNLIGFTMYKSSEEVKNDESSKPGAAEIGVDAVEPSGSSTELLPDVPSV